MRTLFLVYLTLLFFLGLTYFASETNLGPWQIPVSILIAVAKASLIAWVFMDLRYKMPLLRLAACAGLLWMFIFYFLGGLDVLFRPK